MAGPPTTNHAGRDRICDLYDVALLDLDGVVYVGVHAVDYARPALARAREAGMRLAYVTNNASRPPADVARHLRELGLPADPDDVVTSAQAGARVVGELVPPGASVLVVGGPGLEEALAEHGLVPVRSAEDGPEAVAQGYHRDVGWRQLAEAAYALSDGLPWVATNTDLTIPTPRGIAPGNGALVGALRLATGREPIVAGKPEPPMHREAVLRTGARHPLVVGDRLDTDIEGAVRAGVDSLLVLTGVSSPLDLLLAPPERRPTYVAEDLRALTMPVGHLQVPGEVASGADVDRLDALRTMCTAVWSGRREPDREALARDLALAGW